MHSPLVLPEALVFSTGVGTASVGDTVGAGSVGVGAASVGFTSVGASVAATVGAGNVGVGSDALTMAVGCGTAVAVGLEAVGVLLQAATHTLTAINTETRGNQVGAPMCEPLMIDDVG